MRADRSDGKREDDVIFIYNNYRYNVIIFIYNNHRYLFSSRIVNSSLKITAIKILQFNIKIISAYYSDQVLIQSNLEIINSFSDPYLIGIDLNAKHSESTIFNFNKNGKILNDKL